MADIQFDEPQVARSLPPQARASWLTGLVLKLGLAQDEAGAQKVLLIILVLAVLGIIAVWWFGGSTPATIPPPPTP